MRGPRLANPERLADVVGQLLAGPRRSCRRARPAILDDIVAQQVVACKAFVPAADRNWR